MDVEDVVIRKVDVVERKLLKRKSNSYSCDMARHVMVSQIH
jgi:hypothetical protein